MLTHSIPEGWPRPGSSVHFVTEGIESAVAQARAAADGKAVGIHGVGVSHLRYPVRKA